MSFIQRAFWKCALSNLKKWARFGQPGRELNAATTNDCLCSTYRSPIWERVGKCFDKAKVSFFIVWSTCTNARPIIWLEEGERKEIPKACWPTLNQGTINYYCYDKTGDWESYCSKSRHSRCFLWSNEWLAISQAGAMLQTQAPRSREGSWWHPAGNQVDNNGRVEYLRKNLKVSAR